MLLFTGMLLSSFLSFFHKRKQRKEESNKEEKRERKFYQTLIYSLCFFIKIFSFSVLFYKKEREREKRKKGL